MLEETEVTMQECLFASVFNEWDLESLDSVSKLGNNVIEETQLSLGLRVETVSLQEAQLCQALFEEQVVEKGTSFSHHSFRVVR